MSEGTAAFDIVPSWQASGYRQECRRRASGRLKRRGMHLIGPSKNDDQQAASAPQGGGIQRRATPSSL